MFDLMADLFILWLHVMITGSIFLAVAYWLFRKSKSGLRQGGHLKASYGLMQLFLWAGLFILLCASLVFFLRILPYPIFCKLNYSGQEWIFGSGFLELLVSLFIVWIGGFFYGIWDLHQRRAMIREIFNLCEIEGNREILQEYFEVGKQLGLKKQPTLMTNQGATDAFIRGVLHPVVVIPHRIMDKDLRRITMFHELIHYKEHHLFYRSLVTLLNVFFWYIPGGDGFLDHLVEMQETLCDLKVCEVMGQTEDMTSRRYYEEVLAYAITKRQLSPNVVLARMVETYGKLMERMQNVVYLQNGKHRYYLVAAVSSCLIILMIAYAGLNLHPVDLFRQKTVDYHLVCQVDELSE